VITDHANLAATQAPRGSALRPSRNTEASIFPRNVSFLRNILQLRIQWNLSNWDAVSKRTLRPPWVPRIVPGYDAGPHNPTLIPGQPYEAENDPIRGLSFRFSPLALTPTCQRHQRQFFSLGAALPVVSWVESNPLETSSTSSCTSDESYDDLADVVKLRPNDSLAAFTVLGKNPRRLTRWARSVFSRRSNA
jgi:hypothetical protein